MRKFTKAYDREYFSVIRETFACEGSSFKPSNPRILQICENSRVISHARVLEALVEFVNANIHRTFTYDDSAEFTAVSGIRYMQSIFVLLHRDGLRILEQRST